MGKSHVSIQGATLVRQHIFVPSACSVLGLFKNETLGLLCGGHSRGKLQVHNSLALAHFTQQLPNPSAQGKGATLFGFAVLQFLNLMPLRYFSPSPLVPTAAAKDSGLLPKARALFMSNSQLHN